MEGAGKAWWVLRCFLAGWLAVAASGASASERGRVAAAWVRPESYRHFLDDVLYTHDGDDRGFGPEHDLAQAAIAAHFTGLGLTVTLEPVPYAGNTYYNVVGTKLGTVSPDQSYIVGAHYDSVNNPGADDNASGVALIMEAARVLSAYESDFTIRFIAFDREEQGLHGSWAFVQDHIDEDILGMISTDMVAYNRGGDGNVDLFGQAASLPFMNDLANAVDAYGGGLTVWINGPSGGSDHVPFEWAGFEACLMIEDWGNPHYHEETDSVDTPDYIDYDYATRMTRSVVGFLVDHAGVHVAIPDGDIDGDGDVDWDDFDRFSACFTGEGVVLPVGCEFFDFDSDGDVDCADGEILAAVWTEPGDPPVFWVCSLLPATVTSESGRCLTIVPPDQGRPTALLVTGDPDDAAVSCLSLYVQVDGRLGPDPQFRTRAEWDTVYVCDERIIPQTSYQVTCDLGEPGRPTLSPTASAVTALWGDAVGLFEGTAWSLPNGIVDIFDVVAVLASFRGLPRAPPQYRVDLIGVGPDGLECAPDGSIDIVDALVVLDAFVGFTYEETMGCPRLCPP